MTDFISTVSAESQSARIKRLEVENSQLRMRRQWYQEQYNRAMTVLVETRQERDNYLDLLKRLYLNLTRDGSWTMPSVELQDELVRVVRAEVMGE